MDAQTILIILLAILSGEFLLDQGLSFLNKKRFKSPIPALLQGLYKDENYKKSQAYNEENSKFGLLSSGFSFILTVAVLASGFLGGLDEWLRGFGLEGTPLALAFFGIVFLGSDLLSLPFSYYHTFTIEEKYGFNKTSPKVFFMDKLKGYVLMALLGGGLISLLLWLVNTIGQDFWLWFWGVISVFMLLLNMFYTSLIVPLFNKLTPLEDGELRQAIEDYCKSVDFPLTNIFILDGSKRSTKANAFFSGIGKNKKVVLYDTLVDKHTTEELVAVLAHEVGHYKHRHIIWSMTLGILQIGLMLFVLSLMINNDGLSQALGANQMGIHLNLVAFSMLFSPVSTLTGILMNILSRKNEYEADAYARDTYNGEPLGDALKKLSTDNLSNLTPHPAYVFVNHSHPTLLERLEALLKK